MTELGNTNSQGRKCSKCEKFKPWEEFDKKATGVNGRHSRCKLCIKLEKKKWWRKKIIRKSNCPEVVIYSKSDLEVVNVESTGQERRDLETVFRRLIFQSITS